MPPPPSHVCPKCREAQNPEAFVNAKGEPTKWCSWCRVTYRNRFIKPKQVVDEGVKANAVEVVAKDEGYANHPLARLLALSHIAGAKRALAIKAGRGSWKAGKEWQLYYKAKRELEAALKPQEPNGGNPDADCPRAQSDMTPCFLRDGSLALSTRGECVGCGHKSERDQNPDGVSSKGEGETT